MIGRGMSEAPASPPSNRIQLRKIAGVLQAKTVEPCELAADGE